jgi:hypothetical protein
MARAGTYDVLTCSIDGVTLELQAPTSPGAAGGP